MTEYERIVLIKREYRYATSENAIVKATNPSATEISFDTNLNAADAQAMADKVRSFHESPRYFEIEVDGIISLDEFNTGPLAYVLDFPEFVTDSRRMTAVGMKVDYNTNKTTISVRG